MSAFPGGFMWGAALSAHAVEGADFQSDWWRWEQRAGRIADGSTSNVASGHFERFESDYQLARKLGHNAHLFSVSWSRIQPVAGEYDRDVLGHYGQAAATLLGLNLEPICVLHHVAAPEWFSAAGGWTKSDSVAVFREYTARVVEVLSPHVRWWIPILDPVEWVVMSLVDGQWPPGSRNPFQAYRAFENLVAAHVQAAAAIRARRYDAQVGATVRAKRIGPDDALSAWDLRAARREMALSNRAYLDAVCRGRTLLGRKISAHGADSVDFIGVSYFGRAFMRFHPFAVNALCRQYVDDNGERVQVDAAIPDPHAFGDLLFELASYGKPIVVTGNGIATDDDDLRCRYLLDHIDAIRSAIREDVNVRGYFHYSLLDGFEWSRGHTARFGLVHVDRESLARTPNRSAYLYKEICESNDIRTGPIRRFCPDWANRAAKGAVLT